MIRLATTNEIPALNKLIEESTRTLSKGEYTEDEIEGAIRYLFKVDAELIEDKTYYVIENNGVIQACGGWSKRRTSHSSNRFNQQESKYRNPKTDPARIRTLFVHPDYARKGLGTILLNHCEQEALSQGFSNTEMMATLPGAKLYQARGYLPLERRAYSLPNGAALSCIYMTKNILALNDTETLHNTSNPSIYKDDLTKILQNYHQQKGFFRKHAKWIPFIRSETKTITDLQGLLTKNDMTTISQDEILTILLKRDHRNSYTRKTGLHQISATNFFNFSKNSSYRTRASNYSKTEQAIFTLAKRFGNSRP